MYSNQNGNPKIPENLLKNFNPYEILEPQKANPKVDILIDVSDGPTEYDSITHTSLDSALPKINPDLIDLFENVLVTSQQIVKRKRPTEKIEEWPFYNGKNMVSHTKMADAPTTDKIEQWPLCNTNKMAFNDVKMADAPPSTSRQANETADALPSTSRQSNTIESTEDIDIAFHCTPRILIAPNLTSIQLNKATSYIDSPIIDKNVINNNTFDSPTATNVITGDNSFKSEPNPNDDHDDLIDEILQSRSFEMSYNNFTFKNKLVTPSLKINAPIITNYIDTSKNTLTGVKMTNTKLLLTVKKDEKLFLRRSLKSVVDKSIYTRGPNIYEKSLLQPQIMERLVKRRTALEERKKIKRRLILDKGTSTSLEQTIEDISLEFNPELLTEDCNRDRMIGFKTRERYQSFIRTGKY